MLNFEAIRPQPGVIPPRPPSLQRSTKFAESSNDEVAFDLFAAGKAVAFGGISLIGNQGYVVYMIGFLQVKNEHIHGWSLVIGHPEKKVPDFSFIDTTVAPLTEFPFPNVITYFVCQVDENLLMADASQEQLEAAARFILAFISDEGPPDGIDW